jgi:ubiquinol-cytochrome c reductase cytochrome b subunit
MFSALLILMPLAFIITTQQKSLNFRPFYKFLFWVFVFNFFLLSYLGGQPVAEPFITLAQTSTVIYFSYF